MTDNPTFDYEAICGFPPNPAFEDGGCELAVRRLDGAEEAHDALLALNSHDPLPALAHFMIIASDRDSAALSDLADSDHDWVIRLVAQHNWNDPASLTAIANSLCNFLRRSHDLFWIREVAMGRIKPHPRMSEGPSKDILLAMKENMGLRIWEAAS